MPNAEPSDSRDSEHIEAWTIQACRAAEQGDWDAVERCVNRRGELLAHMTVPRAVSSRLVELDERIHMLALTAKAAVAAMLVEVARTRKRLQQLQEGAAGQEPATSRFMNVRG